MSNSSMVPDSQGISLNFRERFGGLLLPVIISAVCPLVIFRLVSPLMSPLAALALTAIPPLLFSLYSWLRTHNIDPISIMALFSLAVSILVTLLAHDPRLFLLREAYLTGAFGLLCLISLMSQKPVAVYIYMWAFGRTSGQVTSQEAVHYLGFVRRMVTLVWGVAFIGETSIDAFLAFHLSTSQFLVIHPFLFWGIIVATMGWATGYSRQAQKKILASLR
jgi:hypothetical protein